MASLFRGIPLTARVALLGSVLGAVLGSIGTEAVTSFQPGDRQKIERRIESLEIEIRELEAQLGEHRQATATAKTFEDELLSINVEWREIWDDAMRAFGVVLDVLQEKKPGDSTLEATRQEIYRSTGRVRLLGRRLEEIARELAGGG